MTDQCEFYIFVLNNEYLSSLYDAFMGLLEIVYY